MLKVKRSASKVGRNGNHGNTMSPLVARFGKLVKPIEGRKSETCICSSKRKRARDEVDDLYVA